LTHASGAGIKDRIAQIRCGRAKLRHPWFSTLPERTIGLMATSRMDSRSASARTSGGDFGLMLPLSVEM
jgi:hypothetical protein